MKDTQPVRVYFGVFELNLKSGELRSADRTTLLQEQPLQILRMLLARDGEMVTREEIRKQLWPNDTIVEFDHSINAAMKKLRQALGDSADEPKYIETVARRGYRLLVNVERPAAPEISAAAPSIAADGSNTATVRQPEPAVLTGRTVSHYRVLDVVGGGGMGVVYRAEDLKLGRQVALKFLPEDLGSEPEAMERFSREARAASSLDHVNICSIYEFGEHDGQPFIVMQLLKGQNLRDRLAALTAHNETLSLEQLLDIAIQIVCGLQAAHEKGVIHRDIKPANIVTTEKGVVKILDFGLAKLLRTTSEEEVTALTAAAGSPTPSTLHLTRTGSAMGTAGYMSPEQVRGEKLDARTDIFSFGLVLYEMATGHRAFSGDTAAQLHAAILNNSPIPLRALNPEIPAKLAVVIDRCLKKECEQRYQSAAEISAALQEVQNEIAPPPASLLRIKRIAVVGLAVLLIAAAAVGFWWWRRPLSKVAFRNYQMTRLTSTGNVAFVDISPDGRYLAYADDEIGKQSIWVRQLATSTTMRLVGPVSAYLGRGVRFTPDGSYVYYSQRDADGSRFSLYRIAVLGGAPEKLIPDIWRNDTSVTGAVDFSPDGKQVVFARYTDKGNYLLTANADGSGEQRLLTLPAREQMRVFAWAPDRQTIAFGIDEAGQGSMNCIGVIASNGGKERRVLRNIFGIHGMTWLPDQSGLVITGAAVEDAPTLLVVSYPDGGLRKITNDIADYRSVVLARDARQLVTVEKQLDSLLWIAPARDPNQAVQLREGAGKNDGSLGVAWLPDGRLVYVSGYPKAELWVANRDGERQQLTHTDNESDGPSVTSAGPRVVFSRGSRGVWMIGSDGSGMTQITNVPVEAWNGEMSPDGKWIVYVTVEGPWKMSLDGSEPVRLDPKGSYPTISPDGRWIAFETSGENPAIEIVPSDGKAQPRFLPFISEPQVPESTNMGNLPIRWTADGKAITYVRTVHGASNLWAQPLDGSPAKQLTNFNSMYIWRHSWSPDGKWLVMARGNFSRDAVMLTDLR